MTLLLDITRAQTRAVKAAVEKIAGPLPGDSADDLAALIADLLDSPAEMRRLNNSLFARLGSGELTQPTRLNTSRAELAELFADRRQVLAQFRALARQLVEHGAVVPNLPKLDAVIDELDALHDEVFSRWGVFSADAAAKARAAHERGETISLDEVIHERSARSHS